MYVTKLACMCRKRIKGGKEKQKEKEIKHKKQKLDKRKMKRENQIKIIIYTRIYLSCNDAKSMTLSKD